jgi:hypothetical protein
VELAELLGRDPSQVSRYLRDPRWPFPKRGPWHRKIVPDMLRWVADELDQKVAAVGPEDDPDETKTLRKEKLRQEVRKLRAQADAAEVSLARERGDLMTLDDAKAVFGPVVAMQRAAWADLEKSMPPRLQGLDAPEQGAVLREYSELQQRRIADAVAGLDLGREPAAQADQAE